MPDWYKYTQFFTTKQPIIYLCVTDLKKKIFLVCLCCLFMFYGILFLNVGWFGFKCMYVFVRMCEHEYMDGCVYIDVLFYIFMMYRCISIFNKRDVCFLFFPFLQCMMSVPVHVKDLETPTGAPVSHRKHCSSNDSSPVSPLILHSEQTGA